MAIEIVDLDLAVAWIGFNYLNYKSLANWVDALVHPKDVTVIFYNNSV